jgi:hypothetical protein
MLTRGGGASSAPKRVSHRGGGDRRGGDRRDAQVSCRVFYPTGVSVREGEAVIRDSPRIRRYQREDKEGRTSERTKQRIGWTGENPQWIYGPRVGTHWCIAIKLRISARARPSSAWDLCRRTRIDIEDRTISPLGCRPLRGPRYTSGAVLIPRIVNDV